MTRTFPGRVAQLPPHDLTTCERAVLDAAVAYVEAWWQWEDLNQDPLTARKRLHRAQRALIVAVETLVHAHAARQSQEEGRT